jgi:hypothetical protein
MTSGMVTLVTRRAIPSRLSSNVDLALSLIHKALPSRFVRYIVSVHRVHSALSIHCLHCVRHLALHVTRGPAQSRI